MLIFQKASELSTTLSFTTTDNGDLTVTFSLTGLGSGNTWQFYGTDYINIQTGTWTLYESGTSPASGSATFTETLAAGYYLGYVINLTTGEASPVALFSVSDTSKSVFEQILDGVVATVQSLTLSDIDNNSIVLRKRPWDRNITKPAIIVSPAPEGRDHMAGTNATDHTSYGCLITIWQVSNQDQTSELTRHLQWRQDIVRTFENQRVLTSVTNVVVCHVDPVSIVMPDKFTSGYDVQTMIIRVEAEEERT